MSHLFDHYSTARRPVLLAEHSPARPGELEIQARLYNGEFGSVWTTSQGVRVEVVHFGDWNREAGPDFRNALLKFGDNAPARADLELDWDVRDWERHGHARNPAYEQVGVHFFIEGSAERFFTRTPSHRDVPQVRLEIEQPAAPVRPCSAPLDEREAAVLVEAAAEFRLRRKIDVLERARRLHGLEGAAFHAIAAALGYKNNHIPFLLAAQKVGLKAAAGSTGEALLFGMAGFLQPRSFDSADEPTRCYLKPLWDEWWRVRDAFRGAILSPGMWHFSNIRPPNHPHRRMGALAVVARRFREVAHTLRSGSGKDFQVLLKSLTHEFWTSHWNLSAAPLSKPVALIGPDRVRDVSINAFYPSLGFDAARKALQAMRGPSPSGRVEASLRWLVGTAGSRLSESAWHQQGLLQLYADFGFGSAREAFERISPPLGLEILPRDARPRGACGEE